MMRSIYGKYLYLCLIGIILEAIILITVVIDSLRLTNGLSQSIFDFVSRNTVTLNIFSFISDWAEILSIFPICLILLVLFLNVIKQRRSRALGRIHDWAKNAVLILSDYRQRDNSLQDLPSVRYEGIGVLIEALKAQCSIIIAAAKVLGGELETKIKKTINMIDTIEEKVQKHDESAYEDLRNLQHNLADVMMSSFELLQNS